MRPPPPQTKGPKPRLTAQLRESAAHVRSTLGLVWRSSRGLTVAMAALTLVGAVVPLGVAYAGKRIVDAVVARSGAATLRWVLVELALVTALAVTQRGLGMVRNVLGLRLGVDINVTILEKALGLELTHFEDSEFYDKLTRARREASSRPIELVAQSFALVQSVITLAGYAALLVRFSAWAALVLFVATVPATVAEMRFSGQAYKLRKWRSPEARRLMYLEYVLANDEHAKEVKLFGIGPLLLDRYKRISEEAYEEDRRLYVKRATWTQVLSLLATGAFYGAYAVMAIMTAAGKLTLGDMTMYVVAFRQGQQAFQSALSGIGTMYEHNLYMSNLWEFLRLADRPVPVPVPAPGTNGSTPQGLVLENVSFRYPGKDTWALRDVSLSIPPGDSIALVGENGAGKTTLVKLVTRLYEPTEGRILLDGRDLRDWEVDALRARFGVLFQDFNQYQLVLRENVGLGSVAHLADEPRIGRAVDRGGATDIVASLKGGLDAPLGRWFQDGSELSGGQWQKIALARAFMREEADILVLDEPTASLDAESEHAVFERFRALAAGRTTIVISHRFPTVRMARRIVVLDHGRIVESGSHQELVDRRGRYARMFELQAEGYR